MSYKIYSSNDADAPQLGVSRAKDVFKAILHSGYGTGADYKEPVGWGMPFEDGDKAVFRPPDERNAQFMRVDTQYVSFYDSMHNVDEGTGEWFGSNTDSSGAWQAVATPLWLLFIVNGLPYFYGLLDAFLPERPKVWVGLSTGYMFGSGQLYCAPGLATLKTAFDAENRVNFVDGDAIWFDIVASHYGGGALGKLPALKMCTRNLSLPDFHEIEAHVYAMNVYINSRSGMSVLDLRDYAS